ncbi:CUB and sushi domain-containing protein, partial [Mytilus galloprovincialis]
TDLDGAPPNSKFADGSHTILYTARDDVGYTATCTIRFQVKVIYCYFGGSLYAEHGRAICHTPALYGTTCKFVCNTGYQLAISSPTTKTCEKNGSIGEWQPLNNFVCEKKNCSDPPAYCNGQLLCSDGKMFDSVCYPTCADGYSTDMTKNLRCNGDEWIGLNIIQPCLDVQPPEFTLCPRSVHAFSDENGFAIVDWPIPEASDNSENADDCGGSSGITVSQVLGQAPRSNFEKGYHDITYTATDNNNNGGLCKFTVIVEELSCDPLVVEDQFLLVQCPNGYSLGSTCEFACFLSYELRGGMNVTCRKHPNFENKAFWDWQNGNESYCEKLTCPDLPPPAGGALACSTALGNQICTMSCSDKYQVAKGTSIQYVCNDEQIWLQGIPPNCTDRVHPANAILPGELFYYYSGDCSDVQESIKNNFVDVMKSLEGTDGWDNICPDYCTVEGVTVTCGPLNGRRRRSIFTRSTDKEIVVDFKVSSQWETTKNLWGNDDTLQALGDLIKLEVSNGAVDVNGTTTGSMTFGWIEFPCEIGQEPVYEADARCVGCAPGKYLNDGNCLDCNKGYFQEKEYQINCTKCPTGKSTADNGSKSEKDCKDMCPPGTYSSTGVEPCSPCALGQYQSMYESTSCLLCDSLEFTNSTGSKSKEDCQGVDLTFMSNKASVKLGSLLSSLDSFSIGLFMKCPNATNTTLLLLMTNFKFSVGEEMVFTVAEHSFHHDASNEVNLRKWSHITLTWDKNLKEVKMYGNGAKLNSSVLDAVTPQDAAIPIGSFLEIMSTEPGCAISGLFLVARVLPENEISALKDSCVASVSNSVYSMNDVFTSEMTGTELSPSGCDAIDECESSPCGNGNVCINKKSGYACQCNGGYTGINCQIPPDFCASNDCNNGSSCLSHFTNYSCLCPANYTGLLCETKIVHGNWGTWINSSDCSVSCGGGSRTRTRYCNDPSPDVYGLNCVGSNTSQSICNTDVCPVCPPYYTVMEYKNSFNCSTDADLISCVVTCKDGYTFVKDYYPLEKYECGPQTGHIWTARPPPCAAGDRPTGITTSTVATYSVNCDDQTEMMSSISTKLDELQCIQNQTCSVKTEVSGCQNIGRKKRSSSFEVTIQLYTDFTQIGDLNLQEFFANNIVSQELIDLIQGYTDMKESIDQLNGTDILTIDVNGNLYTAEISTLLFTTNISCPEGTVNDELLCVECPFGTYWSGGFCVMCPKGYFQDTSRQLSCKTCPVGYSTQFIASRNESECTVPYTITTDQFTHSADEKSEDKAVVTPIVASVVTIVCIGMVLVSILIYRKYFRKALSSERSMSIKSIASLHKVRPSFNETDNSDNCILNDLPDDMRYTHPPTKCSWSVK